MKNILKRKKEPTYEIESSYMCERYWPKHPAHQYSTLQSSLEEAKEWIDEKVEEFRKSWTVKLEVAMDGRET